MNTIRILLADDHVVMRRGIRALLERREDFKVVAEAGMQKAAAAMNAAPRRAMLLNMCLNSR